MHLDRLEGAAAAGGVPVYRVNAGNLRRDALNSSHHFASLPLVEQWPGISLEETHHMRDSDVRYIRLRYPLVEQQMTRADLQRWLARNGWPEVPRSSCIGCPYHSDRQWRELREGYPEEWADAVASTVRSATPPRRHPQGSAARQGLSCTYGARRS